MTMSETNGPTQASKRGPINPYFISYLQPIFLVVVSAVILKSFPSSIEQLYQHFVWAEPILRHIPRLDRIYDFLTEQDNLLRWKAIVAYYSIALISLSITLIFLIIQASHYLAWYASKKEAWLKPLSPQVQKIFIAYILLFLFLPLPTIYNHVIGMKSLTTNYVFSNSIQISDWGYYDLALDCACVIFSVQGLHTLISRYVSHLLNQWRAKKSSKSTRLP